ncbi:MAG: DNA polymerase III subunit gamma/tau [Bacilli bacterium]
MAYQAFYNKYRPQSFEEVVGQKAIVETLKNAISEGKIAHAYLFCGPRGTGKTSMARLFAKALDCKEGLGKQCNSCDSCKAITQGDHPDVIEIDAASNSTVDSVRDLVDNVAYQPIMSRYKVYIIDEVHNMSNSAFNALLKTLEEPPSFVVFILATTEPQKIIPTILSRVQRFDFSKVTEADLVLNMQRILKAENVSYDIEALKAVASLSDGGVRDSLSLLDQLVSYSGTKVTMEDVDNLFGLLSLKDEISIVHLLHEKKSDELIKLIREKYRKGMDIIRLHSDLIAIYKDLLLYKTTSDESLLDKLSKTDCEGFDEPLETLEDNIKTLISAKRDYRNSDNLLNHLELTLLSIILGYNQPKVIRMESKEPTKKEPVLASKAVVVEAKASGFEAKPVEEEKKDNNDIIKYTLDELVNLMMMAIPEEKVKERKAVSDQWENLKDRFAFSNAYEARALYGSKIRLIGGNIILVTNEMLAEKIKINKKSAQIAFATISKETFQKEYHVLAISKAEFIEAYNLFKKTSKADPKPCTIDFGEETKASSSTDFFNELTAQ